MRTEEAIQQFKSQHPETIISEVDFHEEITVEVRKDHLKSILEFFKQSGFETLMDLTGVDYIEPEKRTKVVYWLHNPTNYDRVRIVLFADRDETIPSVTYLWAGASWYERELYDLFGVLFDQHPDLKRILMPDDWQGHPLRKDYALTEEAVEFKNDVRPKVPSEIIPYVR